jgi:hypothetical protein
MSTIELVTLNIEVDLLENLITVFPGGLLPSEHDVLNNSIDFAGQYINQILHMRGEAAISGAMRWPWSQEARIDLTGGLRYA